MSQARERVGTVADILGIVSFVGWIATLAVPDLGGAIGGLVTSEFGRPITAAILGLVSGLLIMRSVLTRIHRREIAGRDAREADRAKTANAQQRDAEVEIERLKASDASYIAAAAESNRLAAAEEAQRIADKEEQQRSASARESERLAAANQTLADLKLVDARLKPWDVNSELHAYTHSGVVWSRFRARWSDDLEEHIETWNADKRAIKTVRLNIAFVNLQQSAVALREAIFKYTWCDDQWELDETVEQYKARRVYRVPPEWHFEQKDEAYDALNKAFSAFRGHLDAIFSLVHELKSV